MKATCTVSSTRFLDSGETLLDHVKKGCATLGLKTQDAEAQVNDRKLKALVITHGGTTLVALQFPGFIQLVCPIDIEGGDAALLAKQPEEIQNRLFAILKREMLQGRCGFALHFDEAKKPPHLTRITIEQKIIMGSTNPSSVQRLADGIQELVVVAFRSGQVLGEAFRNVRDMAKGTTSDFHEMMYK